MSPSIAKHLPSKREQWRNLSPSLSPSPLHSSPHHVWPPPALSHFLGQPGFLCLFKFIPLSCSHLKFATLQHWGLPKFCSSLEMVELFLIQVPRLSPLQISHASIMPTLDPELTVVEIAFIDSFFLWSRLHGKLLPDGSHHVDGAYWHFQFLS